MLHGPLSLSLSQLAPGGHAPLKPHPALAVVAGGGAAGSSGAASVLHGLPPGTTFYTASGQPIAVGGGGGGGGGAHFQGLLAGPGGAVGLVGLADGGQPLPSQTLAMQQHAAAAAAAGYGGVQAGYGGLQLQGLVGAQQVQQATQVVGFQAVPGASEAGLYETYGEPVLLLSSRGASQAALVSVGERKVGTRRRRVCLARRVSAGAGSDRASMDRYMLASASSTSNATQVRERGSTWWWALWGAGWSVCELAGVDPADRAMCGRGCRSPSTT